MFERLKQKAKSLKKDVHILIYAYADLRTPLAAKMLIWITVGYLFSPIDLIPDFIPVLGMLDDLLIVPLLIKASIRFLPEIVLSDARRRIIDNQAMLKKNNWLIASAILLVWAAVLSKIFYLIAVSFK